MASRLVLQNTFEQMLGNRNVYYESPESLKMNYPAIRYSKVRPSTKNADDNTYIKTNCYEVIVISTRPDDPIVAKVEGLPMCEWNRHYVSDNLHHDVLTLYY